jgi:hypothetical protein
MPRFGTKSLFVLVAVAALWLSTFGGYGAGEDVRRSIMLLILVTAGAAAFCARGRQRAFCAAFLAVLMVCGGVSLSTPLYRYMPTFRWQDSLGLSNSLPPPPQMPTNPGPMYSNAAPYSSTYQPTISYTSPAPTLYVAPYPPMSRSATWEAVADSLAAVWTLALAGAAGFVAALVYSQTREAK